MAAPYVSGLIALMKSYDPFIKQEHAYKLLKLTSLDLGKSGWDPEHGWGLVQPSRLKSILQDQLHEKLSEGGRMGFSYYEHFYRIWLENRDPKVLGMLVDTELALMAFAEKHLKSGGNTPAIFGLWLHELERLAKMKSEPFAPLHQRVLKRVRFLRITGKTELDEDKKIQSSE